MGPSGIRVLSGIPVQYVIQHPCMLRALNFELDMVKKSMISGQGIE